MHGSVTGADKQDLREELLQERRALTPDAIAAARAAVRAAVLAALRRRAVDVGRGVPPAAHRARIGGAARRAGHGAGCACSSR